jgi:hypothetical protein
LILLFTFLIKEKSKARLARQNQVKELQVGRSEIPLCGNTSYELQATSYW